MISIGKVNRMMACAMPLNLPCAGLETTFCHWTKTEQLMQNSNLTCNLVCSQATPV